MRIRVYMPLSKPLPEIKKELKDLLVSDLSAALQALRELLPENSGKYDTVVGMLGQLKDANKAYFRNTIDSADFQQRTDTIRANCMDFISTLEESDFEKKTENTGDPDNAKYGSVLYRIPRQMPLLKPVICTIRVAVEEDAVFQDIVIDQHVRVKDRVEVSDMMSAELMDPAGDIFVIRPLSASEQLVREYGYTQWVFSVTPQTAGQHQLLVKVSMMEFIPDIGRYIPKEVSVLELVTVSSELLQAEEADAPPRRTGSRLKFRQQYQSAAGQMEADFMLEETDTDPSPPAPPFPVTDVPAPARRYAGGRGTAILMAILLIGGTATWTLAPEYTRDWWVASIRDNAGSYYVYAKKYRTTPGAGDYVEKAFFLKAEKTGDLSDWRAYQTEYADSGKFNSQVTSQVREIESRRLATLAQAPASNDFISFVKDFPESERLPEIKTVMTDMKMENDSMITGLEDAYLLSLQLRPSTSKISAYLRDFPAGSKLAIVLENIPEDTLKQAQNTIDQAIVKQIQQAESPAEVRKAIPALEKAGSPEAIQQAEKAVSEKQQLKSALPDIKAVKERARTRKGE